MRAFCRSILEECRSAVDSHDVNLVSVSTSLCKAKALREPLAHIVMEVMFVDGSCDCVYGMTRRMLGLSCNE